MECLDIKRMSTSSVCARFKGIVVDDERKGIGAKSTKRKHNITLKLMWRRRIKEERFLFSLEFSEKYLPSPTHFIVPAFVSGWQTHCRIVFLLFFSHTITQFMFFAIHHPSPQQPFPNDLLI